MAAKRPLTQFTFFIRINRVDMMLLFKLELSRLNQIVSEKNWTLNKSYRDVNQVICNFSIQPRYKTLFTIKHLGFTRWITLIKFIFYFF